MDGGFEIFLLLMFVFWILEGIAKAKQRSRKPRLPDQSTPGSSEPISAQGRRAPARPGQRPPTLLELLAAELERAKEAQRQSEQGPSRESAEPGAMNEDTGARQDPIEWPSVSAPSAKKAPPKRDRPVARRPPPRGIEPSRTALHRPPAGSKRRAASPGRPVRSDLRAKGGGVAPGDLDVVEQFGERAHEERTSEAWASGVRDADSGAARETERGAALEIERSASSEAAPRRAGLQRAGIKESQKALEPAKPRVPKPAARSLEPRSLVGASPAELRRILVLQEVLGPPVGLREDRENWDAPREVVGPREVAGRPDKK